MPRHVFTKDDCSKGGKNGSSEDKARAGALGFEATCISHPFFARHYLQFCKGMKRSPHNKAIARQNVARQLIARTGYTGKRQPMNRSVSR